MKKLISWLVIIFISFGGCESLNNNITKRIPLENFFKKTSGRDFQLSPNGEKYSFFSLKEDLEKLFIVDLNNKETYDFSGKIGEEVEKYVWLDSQTIIYQKIDTADNHSRIFSINIESSKIICLTNNEDADYRMIDNMNMVDNEMIIEVKTRTGGSWELDRLNLKSGDIKLVSGDLENIEERILDHSGKYRLAVQKEGTKSYILFRKAETESFLSLLSFDNVREIFHPLFFDSNDKNIYAYSNIGRDKVALVEFDPVIKKEVKIIYEDTDYDLFGDDETDYVKFSEHRNQPAYIFYTTWKRTYHFLDNYYANIFSRVQSEYPDYIIKFVSSDKNEERFIIKISNDRLRGKYYLFNTTDNSFLFIEDIYPWLKEEELAFRKPIRYSSRDGLVVNGYLTLPRNVEPKSLPLVVYPHGGPQWRDCWEMGRFTEIQFLANLGYAVLNVNFRGSTGYGKKFMTAGFKQNGLNVQNDITDGINYLIEKNIIDKDRVAVMGGSYGGYVVLAGLAFTPEIYACGIDLFGVSNFFSFFKALPPWFNKGSLYQTIGNPIEDRDLLQKTSPVFHVDKIKAPLLIAQGGKDPIVNRNESDQMVDTLRKQGKYVEYVFKENEGHGYFRDESNRLELWQTIETFLEKYLREEKNKEIQG